MGTTTPVSPSAVPRLQNSLWLNFDPHEEEKDMWMLEQDVVGQLEKVSDKYSDHPPIGKTGSSDVKQTVRINYIDDEVEEEEEEEDNDDEESDRSEEEEEEEDIDMEIDIEERGSLAGESSVVVSSGFD